jgi:hypothetical protein
MSRPKVVVISYIPLVRAAPGEAIRPDSPRIEEVLAKIREAPAVRACLWTRIGADDPSPVLVVEPGREVLRHSASAAVR